MVAEAASRQQEGRADQNRERSGIIDVDIHERPRDATELLPYLDSHWQRYITECGWRPELHRPHSQLTVGGVNRADATPPSGDPPGSDLRWLRHQVLDQYNEEHAVLTGWVNFNASAMAPTWPEFKSALMTAYNDWQIDRFLNEEPRLGGSIHVNIHDPNRAVHEIERLCEHPRMVQIMIYLGDRPVGDPFYHPVFDAAQRTGLPVAFHHGANSPTALGYQSYYVEWHTLVPQIFMSQLVSMVFNGVLDKYPNLRLIMVEGGFSYLPHLMWRLDQNYRELRVEVPWVTRLPSSSIREQVYFATQPIEEMSADQLSVLLGQIGTDENLCFSSDYPHWDFDSPADALPRGMPDASRNRIMGGNARRLYRKLVA